MPVKHYENFPVASLLLPRKLRRPVETIYRFARSADDLADEGEVSAENRIAALAAYDTQLLRIAAGRPPARAPAGEMFDVLAGVIAEYRLPIALFRDLLSAFLQDVTVKRYDDDAMLLDYCRRSANPVGRLMLVLHGADSELHRLWSDRICTALQWINFWQDIAIDRDKDRVYLPRTDLDRFEVSEAMLMGDASALIETPAWGQLMRHEVARTRTMMLEGAPLALALPGRAGYELRLVVQGGLRILEKIERVDYDVFAHRPTIAKADLPLLAVRALGFGARSGPSRMRA